MIKLITFKSMHTIMCEIEDNGVGQMIIKQPVQLIVQPSPTGQNNVVFVPFNQYAQEFKTGIPIHYTDILCITTPLVNLEDKYREAFGGLLMPQSQSITPE